jgi:hypothetical protein
LRFKSLKERVKWIEIVNKVNRSYKEFNNAPKEITITPNLDKEVKDNINILYLYYKSLIELSSIKEFLVSRNAFALLRESLYNFINLSFYIRLIKIIDKYGRLENKDNKFRSNSNLYSLIAELLDSNPSCIR